MARQIELETPPRHRQRARKMKDPALYKSNYEIRERDRYWTEPWVTRALFHAWGIPSNGTVWEPAAGRGDIVRALQEIGGYRMCATDIDMSEFSHDLLTWNMRAEIDFLSCTPEEAEAVGDGRVNAIITNPPYNYERGIAERFIRQAINYPQVDYVAMLLRSEFGHAKTRQDMFQKDRGVSYPGFVAEIMLLDRPRWDWWYRDEPESQPRHPFSWFVWDKNYAGTYPVQVRITKEEAQRV